MLVNELFKRRGSDLLERFDSGPPAQPIADEAGAEVIKPLESLRKIGFQQGGQPMTDAGAVIDQTPSRLDQILARSRLGMIWPPGPEPVPMVEEQREYRVCIPRIIFGPAGRERVPVLGQRGGGGRGGGPKNVPEKRGGQRTPGLLPTD